MPLNLSVGNEEFTPYLKYNAKAGRFYVRPQGVSEDVEVHNPRLAFDMANIKTGWLFYQEGGGPEKIWDPSRTQMAPRPAGPKKFKRGFEVMVYGGDNLPGVGPLGLREFSSTAGNVIGPILAMYNDYEAGMAANPGKVPFYGCSGVKPVNGAYGTNFEPQFRLIGWVERAKIPAFDDHAERAAIAAPTTGNGHAASNGHSPPPPNGADDYGFPTGAPAPRGGGSATLPDDEIPF